MTISRRWFLAGLALTGAAVPAAYYGHRELTRPDPSITPGEASFDVADVPGQRLADTLRGVWQIRFEGRDAGIEGLPLEGLEVFLDIGHKGRGFSGYLDTAERLRSSEEPRYRVLGDLSGANPKQLAWRLLGASGCCEYEFEMTLDEVWAGFGNAGSGSLSGRVLDLKRPLMLTAQDNRFIAVKRVFPEARERAGLNKALLAWLVSPEHRLFHQLWHASRDKWHKLSEDQRGALRGLGWQPGPRDQGARCPWRAQGSQRFGRGLFLHAPAHARHGAVDAGPAVLDAFPVAAAGTGAGPAWLCALLRQPRRHCAAADLAGRGR